MTVQHANIMNATVLLLLVLMLNVKREEHSMYLKVGKDPLGTKLMKNAMSLH